MGKTVQTMISPRSQRCVVYVEGLSTYEKNMWWKHGVGKPISIWCLRNIREEMKEMKRSYKKRHPFLARISAGLL